EAIQESFASSDLPERGKRGVQYVFDGAGDVGTSDQRTISPDTAPWNKIAWLATSCTPAHLAKHTILTAAHCVTASNGTTRANLRLYPYGHQGVHPHGSHVITNTSWVKVPSQWVTLRAANPGVYDENMMLWDYAVIIVPDPLP